MDTVIEMMRNVIIVLKGMVLGSLLLVNDIEPKTFFSKKTSVYFFDAKSSLFG